MSVQSFEETGCICGCGTICAAFDGRFLRRGAFERGIPWVGVVEKDLDECG